MMGDVDYTNLPGMSFSEGAHNADQCSAPSQQAPLIDRELVTLFGSGSATLGADGWVPGV